MIEWSLFGVLVGIIMGVSGAGGGTIAVPLFIYGLGYDPVTATVASLIAVSVAALSNWWGQRQNTLYPFSFGIFLVAFIFIQILKPVKAMLPSGSTQIAFLLVTLYSLITYWKNLTGSKNFDTEKPKFKWKDLQKIFLSGLGVAMITIFTGLGGGVLIMPLLLGPIKVPLPYAIPTSLLTISSTAMVGAYSQSDQFEKIFTTQKMLGLTLGVWLSVALTKRLIKALPHEQMNKIRVGVYTTVMGVALLSMLYSTFQSFQ
tara:strand:+ start:1007 stop:1783 length:777 start_codon:yes stop_codon:yes gene_type:complete